MKERINAFIENCIGIQLAKLMPRGIRYLPRGVSFYHDLKCDFPNLTCETIFDVGAHMGESIAAYRAIYPTSNIYAFEPTVENFLRAQKNFRNDARVSLFNVALGSNSDNGVLVPGQISSMNSIQAIGPDNPNSCVSKQDSQNSIRIRTLDDIVDELGISNIDILKIDTEGYEVEVLAGSSKTLRAGIPCIVHIEAGMYTDNQHHCSFESITDMLRGYDYQIYAIYDQAQEWVNGKKRLRRVNLAFISRHLDQGS